MTRHQEAWPDAAIEGLKTWWGQGLSASQVASQLAKHHSLFVTRSAVCGKVNRMGLRRGDGMRPRKPRTAPLTRRPAIRVHTGGGRAFRGEVEAIQAEPEFVDLPPDTSPDACTLLELKFDSCRYPMGNPNEDTFRFCGTPHDTGCGPYCPRHREITRSKPMVLSAEERHRRSEQAKNNFRKRMAG